MDGHRKRNLKTSLMFTLALAFLVFSQSTFKLMSDMSTIVTNELIGGDIYLEMRSLDKTMPKAKIE